MEFTIAADHPCLPGHFPGQPIVPGVVLLQQVIEMIEAGQGPLSGLRLPQVKFLKPLLPGERASVHIEGEAPRWRFNVIRDGELLASGEIVGVGPTQ